MGTETRYHATALSSNKNFTEGCKGMGVTTMVSTQRIAWSLADIAEQTGLSLGFLRNEVRATRLPVRRFGRRVLVLDEDLRRYLVEGSNTGKVVHEVADRRTARACGDT